MAWLDDRIRDHPKIIRTSAPAFKQWALALCYCSAHGTEGRLDDAVTALRVPSKIVTELVSNGLWDREDDGLWVHDWQEHNDKRDEKTEERREQARERQKRHRDKVRNGRVTRDSHTASHVTERDTKRDKQRDESVTSHASRAGARPRHARVHDQEEDQEKTQGLTAPSNAAKSNGPGSLSRTAGGPDGDDAARGRVQPAQEDANGSHAAPGPGDGPLGDAVRDELARTAEGFVY